MSKQIKKSEIAEEGVLDNLLQPLKELLKITDSVDAKLKDTAKTINESFKFTESSKGLRELEVNLQKTNKLASEKKNVQQDQTKIQKQLASAQERLNSLSTEEAKELIKTREAIRNKTNELKASGSAYKKLSNKSRKYKNESKELGAQLLKLEQAGKKNTKEFRDLSTQYKTVTAQARTTDKQLKKLDQTVGDNFRNVGNYRDATQKLTGALGKLGIAFGIGAVVRNVTGIMTDFNQAQQDLLAISGKSAEQLEGLTKQAKELGATTAFSATEITGLQIELAKLGFTTNEILQGTGGISAFASATGADLPQAAKLAGSALRAFNLDASEMDRVVSVLGVATTKTALDVSALETGLSSVAPVAASFGFSIEDTTALLGQLSNAGFDASSAATSTRNILLNLADANGSLAKELGRPIKSADDLAGALQELQAKGIDLGEALELTDKRSVAAFQTFMNGADSLVDLRDSITDVNDELKEMEEKRLDSITGQMQLLNSAWEGFILGTDGATGASNALKNVIGFLAENLNTILSVIGRVIIIYGAYRTRLLIVNSLQNGFLKGVKNTITSIPKMIRGIKGASLSFKGLGTAMKGIPFVAVVAGLVELTNWLWNSTDAVDAKTEAEKLHNDEIERGLALNAERQGKLRDLNTQVEIAETLSQSQLKSLKQQLESQIALSEENDKSIKTEKERIQSFKEHLSTMAPYLDMQQKLKKAEEDLTGTKGSQRQSILEQINAQKQLIKQFEEGVGRDSYNKLIKQGIDLNDDEIKTIEELQKQLEKVNSLIVEDTNQRAGSTKVIRGQNKELQKQILNLKEIDKLLNEGASLEDIEDSEIDQKNKAIEKSLTERLTMINDAERNQTLTEKEANDQRLIAEIDALHEKRKALILYGRDVTDIDKEISEARLALSKEFIEKDKEIQDDYALNAKQAVEQIGNAIADTYSTIFQRQIDELKQQEDIARQVYGTLEMLAAQGNIAAQESLAEQIQAQQDAQREQIKLQQKQANIEKARQVYAIIQSQLDAGKSPGQAIAEAGGYMTAIQGLIQSLPSFYEGTEDTGKVGKALDSKGGRLAVLHNNERVLTADQNKHLQGIPNPMIPVLVNKALDSAGNSYDLLAIDELRRTRQAIERLPQSTYQLESAMGHIIKMVATHKTGNSTTKNTYK